MFLRTRPAIFLTDEKKEQEVSELVSECVTFPRLWDNESACLGGLAMSVQRNKNFATT